MELSDLVSRFAFYFDPLSVFHKPLHLPVDETFLNIGFNIWVNGKCDALFVLLNQNVVEVIFNIVKQQYSRPYSSCTVTGWARRAFFRVLESAKSDIKPVQLAFELSSSRLGRASCFC